MLRDHSGAAEDAMVDVTAIDRACLNRQMRPDRLRNPAFDLRGGNADDRSGVLLASRQRRTRDRIELAREEGMFVRALQSLSRPGGRVGFNSGRRTSCLMEERAGDVGRPRRAGFAVPMAAQ